MCELPREIKMFFCLYGPNGTILDFVRAFADFAEGERTEHASNVEVAPAKRFFTCVLQVSYTYASRSLDKHAATA